MDSYCSDGNIELQPGRVESHVSRPSVFCHSLRIISSWGCLALVTNGKPVFFMLEPTQLGLVIYVLVHLSPSEKGLGKQLPALPASQRSVIAIEEVEDE